MTTNSPRGKKAGLEPPLMRRLKPDWKPVVFLSYPPIYGDLISGGMIDLMRLYQVKRCYYGHLHGDACRQAFEGNYLGIDFSLVSADFLSFSPKRL